MIALLMRVTRYYQEWLIAECHKSLFYIPSMSLWQLSVTNRLDTILQWWMAQLLLKWHLCLCYASKIISYPNFSRKARIILRMRWFSSCANFLTLLFWSMCIENEMELWLDQLLQPQADCSRVSSCPPATEIALPLVPLKTWSFLASLNYTVS